MKFSKLSNRYYFSRMVKKNIAVFVFFSLLINLIYGSLQAQCPDRYTTVISDTFIVHNNLPFGHNISENGEPFTALLDVYEPVDFQGDLRPLVILAHGGSFTGGDKRDGEVRWLCEDLAKHGIVAASINYRVESDQLSLISEEKMVKAVLRGVEDTKAAIRFFYKDIEQGNSWSIEPGNFILGGSSAGSICVLHAHYMDEFSILKPRWKRWVEEMGIDTVDLNGNSGNPGYPDSVAGVINISGAVANLDFIDNNANIPILSIHNSGDLTIPYQFGFPYLIPTLPIVAGSRAIHTRMLANNGPSSLVTYEVINHVPHTEFITGEQLFPEYNEVLDHILQFIGEVLPCAELPTGISPHEIKKLIAYPNPLAYPANSIRIEGVSDVNKDRVVFQLVDGAGKLIERDLRLRNEQLQLPHLEADGIYFLIGKNMNDRKDTYVIKLQINK